MSDKIQVLFLCTGNSCRSQMAEGLARFYHNDCIEPFSAGIEQHGLNKLAVKVMAEIGIDISQHNSKTIDDIRLDNIGYVVTVCSHADKTCPVFPNRTKIIHQGFDDPPKLALNAKNDIEAMHYYRVVRDQIKTYIQTLPKLLDI